MADNGRFGMSPPHPHVLAYLRPVCRIRWEQPLKGIGIVMDDEAGSWLGRHRKLIIFVAIVVVAAIVFMPGLLGSRLNNEEQEIDLWSGRARFTRHFLFCQVRREVRPTALSETIALDGRAVTKEQWVRVVVKEMGLGKNCHFRYHGAFAEANGLARLWEFYEFDTEARAKSAKQLLRAMREGGSYFVGSDYMRLLQETLGHDPVEGRTIAASEIPDDLVDRTLAKRAEEMRQR